MRVGASTQVLAEPVGGHVNRRSETWSKALLVVGALGLFLTGIFGWLNSSVVNGEHFADLVNQVRHDQSVRVEVGQVVAAAALDAQPDLIAIEPAIAAGAAAVASSPVLDPVFTQAVRSFHDALTVPGSDSAVLTVADLGATVSTALDRFVPEVAAVIPDDLNLTLAEVGGQTGVAEQIIPIIQAVATLAWVVPLLALLAIVLGLLISPDRRISTVRLGWMTLVVSGFLGLLVIGMNVASMLVDDSTLRGAVVAAGLEVFSQPLSVRFVAMGVIGGLLVASAGALLPQVDVTRHARFAMSLLGRRPTSTSWSIVRAMAVIGLGLLIVLFPTRSAQIIVVIAGLAVLLYGISELDALAERDLAADESRQAAARAAAGPDEEPEPGRRSPARWLIPAAGAAAGLLVIAALIIPSQLPQGSGLVDASAVDTTGCNGHDELCDVPFDQVAIAATHNSMSIADGTWFLAEQPKDMIDSLDDGIRGLLVDTWYAQPTADGGAIMADRSLAGAEAQLRATYGEQVTASVRRTIDRARRDAPTGPPEPYFCHTVCEIGSDPMAPIMKRLDTWLDEHPREVVVLFIQDTVTPADTDAVLRAAGLVERAYVHPDGAQWPTLGQMIDADQRLLVLMENEGGGTEFPYLHQGFDLVADTAYTFDTAADFTCTLERGRPDSPLFAINHWLAGFTRLVSNSEQVNAYDVLRARVDECQAVRDRSPGLIAVNWYDRGDLFRVVDELNGVG
ncbi:MAG: hypothetical protein WCF36_05730 [Candidatus Nanopelagicales bacterium]